LQRVQAFPGLGSMRSFQFFSPKSSEGFPGVTAFEAWGTPRGPKKLSRLLLRLVGHGGEVSG
jgi:hypothetical protein